MTPPVAGALVEVDLVAVPSERGVVGPVSPGSGPFDGMLVVFGDRPAFDGVAASTAADQKGVPRVSEPSSSCPPWLLCGTRRYLRGWVWWLQELRPGGSPAARTAGAGVDSRSWHHSLWGTRRCVGNIISTCCDGNHTHTT